MKTNLLIKLSGALFLVMILLLTGIAGACTEPAPAPSPEPAPAPSPEPENVYELTMATMHPGEAGMNKVINQGWFNWLDEASSGRIKVTLMPASQAAAPDKHFDAAQSGIVDIACQHMGMTVGRFPLLEVIDLPLIFEYPSSRSAALTCMALYDKYPEIQDQFKDVQFLNFHFGGVGHLHTTDKQVKTIDDLKGMVILTVGKGASESVKALGGSPEPGDPMQVYDLLAKGAADGMSLNYEGAHLVFHITEVTNYVTEIGLPDAPFVHVMNMDTWNSLPDDLQELFVGDNAWRLAEVFGYEFDKTDIMAREELDKILEERGYTGVYPLPTADRDKWIEAVEPVLEGWVAQAAGVVGEEKARAILDDTKNFAKQYRYDTTPFDDLEQTLKAWGAPGY